MSAIIAKPGDTISFSKTISESDVYLFAGIIGDFYELHLNKEYAEKTPVGRQIAHGVLVLGLASTVATNIQKKYEYPSPALLYGYDKLRFIKPTFFGDTLTACQTVTEVDKETGKMLSKVEITNQRGEVVLAAVCIQKFM
ncbi:MaoC family dehydratase [Deltaproteobacteria bacterium]|nr:MaoC family dehydratase [Deltaproteobacteria bacterium]GHV52546.1 MaoC family dehydratase [Deltaproteobacteria bacterium]